MDNDSGDRVSLLWFVASNALAGSLVGALGVDRGTGSHMCTARSRPHEAQVPFLAGGSGSEFPPRHDHADDVVRVNMAHGPLERAEVCILAALVGVAIVVVVVIQVHG